jgi:hypothetical protein
MINLPKSDTKIGQIDWNLLIPRVDPIVFKKVFSNRKIKNKKNQIFPLQISKILCLIKVKFILVKYCGKTLKIMEMHFFILNNDTFFGQQVWITFGQIGTPLSWSQKPGELRFG